MSDSELEDWTNLVKSPGWFRLKDFAKRKYGDLIAQHVGQAANERDDIMALNQLRQVVASHKAVENLLQYPEEAIKKLDVMAKMAEQPVNQMSRRGNL